ncbi:MAG: hypothetical protein IAX21_03210 [Candidatus Bathyarchaeota archaeon]|nr:MAG: hypothetical protein IAX21_03210 [Candidatus Bathyarchaeota archaeon]
MKKPKFSTIEMVFVLIAATTLFTVTVYELSTTGVLPGNDPAVHLAKSKQIILDEKISYSEVAWYPPFFHTILAILQIFAGTMDVMVAAFILKLLIATFNVLALLSVYLLTRKIFGIGTAVVASLFVILSVPLSEMVFWGGYANLMGLAYIAFIFYIMTKEIKTKPKLFLLFLGSFTLGLAHQLTAFVFVFMFIPVFLLNSIGSKKRFFTFFAVIIGGGLALLAWYAQVIIDYADIIIDYVFYSSTENYYQIPLVGLENLLKNFGTTIPLAIIGIPIMFYILWKKKALKDSVLLVFWLAVPVFWSQSFHIGIQLPYGRFVSFFATPIAILCGIATYFLITKIPTLLESFVLSKFVKNIQTIEITKIIVIISICSLLVVQGMLFVERLDTYPEYYQRASIPSYSAGLWVKEHTVSLGGTAVTSRSPGSWFYAFTDISTIQEVDPMSSRSVVAESVLYSFYEMENTVTSTREYDIVSPSSGQEIHVSNYNIWKRVLSMPNSEEEFRYLNNAQEWVSIPFSETQISVYWTLNTTDKAQLVTEYNHELFTITKTVTVQSTNTLIDVHWDFLTHQDFAKTRLAVAHFFDLSLDFKEVFIPNVIDWENPWDIPEFGDTEENWALIAGPDILSENRLAVLDPTNGIIAGFEITMQPPNWCNIGALENRFIDAVRLTYYYENITQNEIKEAAYTILVHAFQDEEIERWSLQELINKFDYQTEVPLYARDFLTYIEENNIRFVAVDTQRIVSTIPATPALDKIYSNNGASIYTTKK